jgi:hypothetical protein
MRPRTEAEARSRGVIVMRGKIEAGIVLWLALLVIPGCASTRDARYVYQDSEFGVVAIPRNTTRWPDHYREQAEALMAQHFPQGYEIVRAEEVVEGSRTLTVGRTGSSELTPQISPHLLALVKVGGSVTRSQADTLRITECRIIYKKADAQTKGTPGGFAPEASLTPTCYLDPNTEARKKDKEPAKVSDAKKDGLPEASRTGDSHAGG